MEERLAILSYRKLQSQQRGQVVTATKL